MKKYFLLTVFASFFLAGCGTMTVEVDIFDRAKNETPFILPKINKQESRIQAETLTDRYETDRKRLLQLVDEATDNSHITPNTTLYNFNAAANLSIKSDVNDAYQNAEDQYALGLSAMQNYRVVDGKKAAEKYEQLLVARSTFDKGDSTLLALRTKVYSFVDQLNNIKSSSGNQSTTTMAASTSPATTAKSPSDPVAEIKDVVTAATDDIIAGQGLLDDPMASAVIGADKKSWIRNYNRTFGLGLIGDTDLAIQMNSIGDFTIKGARIDASKATAATFDGIRLAVSIAAAAYGVPIPLGKPPASSSTGSSASTASTDTSAAQTPQPADAVSQAKQDINAAANSKMLATQAEINILDAIIAQRAIIKDSSADPNTLKASILIIQNTYAANRANLVQSTTAKTGG